MCINKLLLSPQLLVQVLAILCVYTSSVFAQASTQTSIAPSWPTGTEALGSSVHAELTDGSKFDDSYAIDGNYTTKWNDDSLAAYPDTLTISIPIDVTLTGIFIISGEDGWLSAYTVDTYNGTDWTTVAEIGNATSPLQLINFPSPVIARKVRINVTLDQSSDVGEYTRIHEVYPLFGTSSSTASESTSTASNSTSTISTQKCTSKKCSNAGAIAAGVIGGAAAAIILVALAGFFVLRRRRNQDGSDLPEPKSNLYPQELAPVNSYPAANTYEAAGETGHAAYAATPTELRNHASLSSGTVGVTKARQVHEKPAELPSRTSQNTESLRPTTTHQIHENPGVSNEL